MRRLGRMGNQGGRKENVMDGGRKEDQDAQG